jgi:hypothetical protein
MMPVAPAPVKEIMRKLACDFAAVVARAAGIGVHVNYTVEEFAEFVAIELDSIKP